MAVDDRLVPVRVEEVPAAQVPALLRPLRSRDLFGVAEEQARQILLEAVAGPRRPDCGSSCQHASTSPRSASRIKIGYSVPDFNPVCFASA